jgi:hypothetical protein
MKVDDGMLCYQDSGVRKPSILQTALLVFLTFTRWRWVQYRYSQGKRQFPLKVVSFRAKHLLGVRRYSVAGAPHSDNFTTIS